MFPKAPDNMFTLPWNWNWCWNCWGQHVLPLAEWCTLLVFPCLWFLSVTSETNGIFWKKDLNSLQLLLCPLTKLFTIFIIIPMQFLAYWYVVRVNWWGFRLWHTPDAEIPMSSTNIRNIWNFHSSLRRRFMIISLMGINTSCFTRVFNKMIKHLLWWLSLFILSHHVQLM
jgi:hypothetical protein